MDADMDCAANTMVPCYPLGSTTPTGMVGKLYYYGTATPSDVP